MNRIHLENNPEWCRINGKLLFFDKDSSPESRQRGIQLLIQAQQMNDPEATYLIGWMLVKGILNANEGNRVEQGLELLSRAAESGWPQAKSFLEVYYDQRYMSQSPKVHLDMKPGPLKDFEGKLIKISRKGMLTPVDAELSYENGKNVLQLSANIQFVYGAEPVNQIEYEQAILDGMLQWQGTYEVFGGQQLEVKVNLTTEDRMFDNVVVIQLDEDTKNTVRNVSGMISTEKGKAAVEDLMISERSFAFAGIKWSSKSRKVIYMQSPDGRFDDYEELKAVAKHEFGHALGLGDLYYSPNDNLEGLEPGNYWEIDSYHVSKKNYHLVMCDHHGTISNNDIEMVVLAFWENRMQNYQSRTKKEEISKALGRGN